MAPEPQVYSTKRLTKSTLPDFERFFEKHPAPGAFMCWCLYHQQAPSSSESKQMDSRVKIVARNRQRKRELVDNGYSHGILVYANGEPVGWCQYGSREELPRIDSNRSYRRLIPESHGETVWRITCFTVDKRHRRSGVATIALKAALEVIRKKGGGLVEAYPIIQWGAYREWFGTVSMFQKEGFKIVAPFGRSNVVMRRTI